MHAQQQKKKPSREAEAASLISSLIDQWAGRWDVQAVGKGTTDAAAQLQAAKSLQALLSTLAQHRTVCRRAQVRQHFAAALPPALPATLLSSGSNEVVGIALRSLLELATLVPGLLALQLAPRLLQMLCDARHGAAASRLVLELLGGQWRASALLPAWREAGATEQLRASLQLQLGAMRQHGQDASAAGRAVKACASHVVLLARLVGLAGIQQMLPDVAGDEQQAAGWLQLLVDCTQTQQEVAAACLPLLDSCCQLLQHLSAAPAVWAALRHRPALGHRLVELLHRMLQRPCQPGEVDESSVLCWTAAARVASLPMLWQLDPPPAADPAAAALAQHSMLASMAAAAAATLSGSGSRACGGHSRLVQQLDAAAMSLLAAAALPPVVPLGCRGSSSSPYTAAILLGSGSGHVLLHVLSVAVETNAAASVGNGCGSIGGAAAAAATGRGAPTAAQPASGGDALFVSAPPLAQELPDQLAWMLLRMVCSQAADCVQGREDPQQAAGADSDGSDSASASHPQAPSEGGRLGSNPDGGGSGSAVGGACLPSVDTVLRVLRAYSAHIPTAAPSLARLVGSLRLLLCEAALCQELRRRRQKVSRLSLRTGRLPAGAAGAPVYLGGAGSLLGPEALGLLLSWQPSQQSCVHRQLPMWESLVAAAQAQGVGGRGLAWRLATCAYVSLAVALAVQEAPPPAVQAPSPAGAAAAAAAETGAAAAAARMAAVALRVLLPALLAAAGAAGGGEGGEGGDAPAAGANNAATAAAQAPVLHGLLECSMACLQALVLLSRWLLADLPQRAAAVAPAADGSAACAGCSAAEAAASAAAEAALRQLAAALGSDLRGLLSAVVAEWPAAAAGVAAGSALHAALLDHAREELRCWAASALASCFGQLGASGAEGQTLASARQGAAAAAPADAQLALADGGPPLPVHAAVLLASCPVLAEQLMSSAGGVAAAGQGPELSLRLSAAVGRPELQRVLDYVYSGAASVPDAGLAAQLAAFAATCGQEQQQQRAARGRGRSAALQQQLSQLEALQAIQASSHQELQSLGRLAKKLSLPLLAAMSRQPLPLPGDQLQDLCPRLAGLLPQHMIVLPQCAAMSSSSSSSSSSKGGDGDDGSSGISGSGRGDGGDGASMLRLVPPRGSEEAAHAGQAPAGCAAAVPAHTGCAAYLAALAAVQSSAPQFLGVTVQPGSAPFADVLLAAPALLHVQPQDRQQQQQEQQQQQLEAVVLLPAHQVLLSASVPYFESLFSQRWQPMAASDWLCPSTCVEEARLETTAAGAPFDMQQQQQQQQQQQGQPPREQQLRVVVVPEADVHVAAALQRFLYSGRLDVRPPQAALVTAGPQQARRWEPSEWPLQLSGCSWQCHEARTLLRLCRCADLLLVPGLQGACLTAVEAAAARLRCECCLQLLIDCYELGAAATADVVFPLLVSRFDRETATSAREWHQLTLAQQDALVCGFVDKRRQAAADGGAEAVGSGGGPAAAVATASGLGGGAAAAAATAIGLGSGGGLPCVLALPASQADAVDRAVSDFSVVLQRASAVAV